MPVRLRFLVALACLGGFLGACDRAKIPETARHGTYGPLTNAISIPAREEKPALLDGLPWTNSALSVVQTELSPATLWHSSSKSLSFFTNLPEPLAAPAFAAISTEQGPKIFRPGETIDPARMKESWFVVWWAGARGWTNWDSPWLLSLQHRPAVIRFDTNGLHFTFAAQAGYAAVMPLYGYFKAPQLGRESLPVFPKREKQKRVLTWEWAQALPADPLARARYWASALREFPISCEESFRVDRAHDSITIRQSFRWISWDDDWRTKHWKLAPLSPVLAHAFQKGMAMKFSGKPFDMEIFTAFGPYYGIENTDSYEVTLPVLGYVHETEGTGAAGADDTESLFNVWQTAHARNEWDALRERWPALRDRFRNKFHTGWAAFVLAEDGSALDSAAEALGAARIAYRLGEADTYVVACERFARAVAQSWVQQRGLDYFREHQPWHSMEMIPPDAALGSMTPHGWEIVSAVATPNVANAPDLARLWRGVHPGARQSRSDGTIDQRERLISGAGPTGFLSAADAPVGRAVAFLVQEVVTSTGSEDGGTSTWPQIVWPDWKRASGQGWEFGSVTCADHEIGAMEIVTMSGNTRVLVFRAR